MSIQGFAPGQTLSISASTTSASATFTTGIEQNTMRVYNAGSATVFVRWGVGAQTALTTDMPIPAGAIETFNKGRADTVAAITASGTATLYITAGEGV